MLNDSVILNFWKALSYFSLFYPEESVYFSYDPNFRNYDKIELPEEVNAISINYKESKRKHYYYFSYFNTLIFALKNKTKISKSNLIFIGATFYNIFLGYELDQANVMAMDFNKLPINDEDNILATKVLQQ